MQALYAHNRNADLTLEGGRKNLAKTLDNFIDQYHYILFTFTKVVHFLTTDAEIKAGKLLPTEKDGEVNLKLLDNNFFKALESNSTFDQMTSKGKFDSLLDANVIATLYRKMANDPRYVDYLDTKLSGEKEDFQIVKYIIEDLMFHDEVFQQHMEDLFPRWQDDNEFLYSQMGKRLKAWKKDAENVAAIVYQKDASFREIEDFADQLFLKTADRDPELHAIIGKYLKNWDEKRLALIDTILMKMAACELLYFKEIPVKVTINEYIDISKSYSTPKSKEFINGILDKLMKDLSNEGRIVKEGRGLKN
ncbi:MAG: transcription antitermination factor NusB [Saprospiraceae bacterium]|nr:transcription antitermination factor NusB [Saprospiraceae bacterium]